MSNGAVHYIEADLDAQLVVMRANLLAGLERLLERHAAFTRYLEEHDHDGTPLR